VTNDSTVNDLGGLIPPDIREGLLSQLGFEKKPIVRTRRVFLVFLILIMIMGVAAGVIVNSDSSLRILFTLLVGGAMIWTIIKYYKDEAIPKWRRKKTI